MTFVTFKRRRHSATHCPYHRRSPASYLHTQSLLLKPLQNLILWQSGPFVSGSTIGQDWVQCFGHLGKFTQEWPGTKRNHQNPNIFMNCPGQNGTIVYYKEEENTKADLHLFFLNKLYFKFFLLSLH